MANPLPPAAAPPVQNGRAAFLALLAALVTVLAFLFAKSLLPEYVVFANDGPLGATSATCGRMPEGMFGVWNDLNWVGNVPNISNRIGRSLNSEL